MADEKKITKNKTSTASTITAKKKLIKPAAKSAVVEKTSKESASKPVKTTVSKPIQPNSALETVRTTVQSNKQATELVKKEPLIASSLTIKNNLVELIPDYDRQDETIAVDYMSEDKKIHFRSLLTSWKQQLMQEVDRTVDYMKDEATNFADPSDRATQEEEFSLELRTRDRERKLINKIDEALARLDDNEYGYCDACGIEIGYKRLEARPTATLCIDCKTIDEIRERQLAL